MVTSFRNMLFYRDLTTLCALDEILRTHNMTSSGRRKVTVCGVMYNPLLYHTLYKTRVHQLTPYEKR